MVEASIIRSVPSLRDLSFMTRFSERTHIFYIFLHLGSYDVETEIPLVTYKRLYLPLGHTYIYLRRSTT